MGLKQPGPTVCHLIRFHKSAAHAQAALVGVEGLKMEALPPYSPNRKEPK